MPQQQNAILTQKEGRLTPAIQAFRTGQFKSIRRAAAAYNVRHQQLSKRLQGITFRPITQPNCQKLTKSEEQTIVRYILDLDSRGFAPQLCEVADMAEKLLRERDGQPLGKCWAERFVTRTDELKTAFSRAKDRQRIQQEDPEVINAWFKLVRETIEKQCWEQSIQSIRRAKLILIDSQLLRFLI
jgi:hypothetical protein